jgi:3-hydroxyacyl-CoA dehydrogenase / enoyl-CoA hydratase / 3-hydroxybutyryl-CoA epimerase / enoyl-CoA isomerase
MLYAGSAIQIDVDGESIAELRFDLKDESVNKLNALTLRELGEGLDRIAGEPGIKGLMLTSGKSVFIVGADITEFGAWFAQPDDALKKQMLEVHHTFAKLEDLPFPTVVVINGLALGGGFEVSLACDFRIMATSARVGLPEVKLGIFPGWGGTVRLPRVIGLEQSIEWITRGQDHDAQDALSTGAVDAVVEPTELREAAFRTLRQCAAGELDYLARRRAKAEPLGLNDAERTQIFSAARARVEKEAGEHYPAPGIALGAMEKHVIVGRDEASEIECEAFTEVARTDASRNLIGLFLNDQEMKREARQYEKSARSISSAAVIGAGIMGGGIAYQAALKGTPIAMKDIRTEALDQGVAEAKKLLNKRVERGLTSAEDAEAALERITPSLSYDDVKGADIVIEAVVENRDVKKSVLAEVEAVVDEGSVIATNTSTISVDELAAVLNRPERFCGMHFFNPVHVMPLVEVIRGERTSEETVATTVALARAMSKSPIVVNNCPGFLVNRILFPYFNGFEMLLRDGADFRQVDRVMERFGWPMGPAYLLDVVGIDTSHHAAAVVAEGYPDRMELDFKPVSTLMYESERLGQKSGSGYYRYEKDDKGRPKKVEDPLAFEIVARVAGQHREFSDEDIQWRMMIPMCLEAVRCYEEHIVSSAAAVDMGLIWGLGFPPFRGGALRFIDTVGASRFCEVADRYQELGAAYHPTDGLRAMAQSGKKFFS